MIFISIIDEITFSLNDVGVSYGITGCIKVVKLLVGDVLVEELDEDEEEESDEEDGVVGGWVIYFGV